MSAEQPGSRPLASAALRRVRQIQLSLSDEALVSRVPYSPFQMERLSADNAKTLAEIEARTKAHLASLTLAPVT